MIKIYRMQDADGRGPWKPGFSKNWVEERDDFINLVPIFLQCGMVFKEVLYGEYSGCGCETIEQAQRWFAPGEYEKLLSFKYQFVAMEVNRIITKTPIQLYFGRAIPMNQDFEIVNLYGEEKIIAK